MSMKVSIVFRCIVLHDAFCVGDTNTMRESTMQANLRPPSVDRACDRLRAARQRAGFEAAADFAREMGMPISSYRAHENGYRNFKWDEAQSYADKLRVSVVWLMVGEGCPTDETSPFVFKDIRQAPVVSFAELESISKGEEVSLEGKLTYPVQHDTDTIVAVQVNDTCIDQAIGRSAIVVIDYADKALEDGAYYLMRHRGRYVIRRFVAADGPMRFEPYSSDPMNKTIYPTEELTVMGRLVWSLCRL